MVFLYASFIDRKISKYTVLMRTKLNLNYAVFLYASFFTDQEINIQFQLEQIKSEPEPGVFCFYTNVEWSVNQISAMVS